MSRHQRSSDSIKSGVDLIQWRRPVLKLTHQGQHRTGNGVCDIYDCVVVFAHSRPQVERNPSAIKQMLLDWCKAQCEGYEVLCARGVCTNAYVSHFASVCLSLSLLSA